jgi:hypothetical protein
MTWILVFYSLLTVKTYKSLELCEKASKEYTSVGVKTRCVLGHKL